MLGGRVLRVREQQRLPRTLTLEQVRSVLDVQGRTRDRFLFALLCGTGMGPSRSKRFNGRTPARTSR
jgi:integrase